SRTNGHDQCQDEFRDHLLPPGAVVPPVIGSALGRRRHGRSKALTPCGFVPSTPAPPGQSRPGRFCPSLNVPSRRSTPSRHAQRREGVQRTPVATRSFALSPVGKIPRARENFAPPPASP